MINYANVIHLPLQLVFANPLYHFTLKKQYKNRISPMPHKNIPVKPNSKYSFLLLSIT